MWKEIGFYLSVISTSVTAFFFACMYTGAPLSSLLQAAAILHFYSLVIELAKWTDMIPDAFRFYIFFPTHWN